MVTAASVVPELSLVSDIDPDALTCATSATVLFSPGRSGTVQIAGFVPSGSKSSSAPLCDGPNAVILTSTSDTPLAGTPPTPSIGNVTVSSDASGAAATPPAPLRVSNASTGLTGKNCPAAGMSAGVVPDA